MDKHRFKKLVVDLTTHFSNFDLQKMPPKKVKVAGFRGVQRQNLLIIHFAYNYAQMHILGGSV